MKTKVIFSHGKESGPWGTKIKRLASIAKELGCEVESIDYTAIPDPNERVKHLQNILKDNIGCVLVGSSMGGYVSLVASQNIEINAIFLMAPALYFPGYDIQNDFTNIKHIEVIHGWSDDVVPHENSIRFAKNVGCSLHLVAGDHRLTGSLDVIEVLFSDFLMTNSKK